MAEKKTNEELFNEANKQLLVPSFNANDIVAIVNEAIKVGKINVPGDGEGGEGSGGDDSTSSGNNVAIVDLTDLEIPLGNKDTITLRANDIPFPEFMLDVVNRISAHIPYSEDGTILFDKIPSYWQILYKIPNGSIISLPLKIYFSESFYYEDENVVVDDKAISLVLVDPSTPLSDITFGGDNADAPSDIMTSTGPVYFWGSFSWTQDDDSPGLGWDWWVMQFCNPYIHGEE